MFLSRLRNITAPELLVIRLMHVLLNYTLELDVE
jgi:hypothetical protein